MVFLCICLLFGIVQDRRERMDDLAQDFGQYVITNYKDIFERNMFRELPAISEQNQLLREQISEKHELVSRLEWKIQRLQANMYRYFYHSRLKSKCFLAWKKCIPYNEMNTAVYQDLQKAKITLHKITEKFRQKEYTVCYISICVQFGGLYYM